MARHQKADIKTQVEVEVQGLQQIITYGLVRTQRTTVKMRTVT